MTRNSLSLHANPDGDASGGDIFPRMKGAEQ
jgi:hypothetical protein